MPEHSRMGFAPNRGRRRKLAALAALPTLPALLAAGLPAAEAQGAPRLRRFPYVQRPGTNDLTVLWQTDLPAMPAVEFRTGDQPWRKEGGALARNHAVQLTGLDPGAAYAYRVLAGGQVLWAGGHVRTLPGPNADALKFAVYGDTRTNYSPHAGVIQAILRDQPLPDLLLHAGDLVESGLQADQWDTFFRIERDLLAQVPVFPALGNHEENSPQYFQNFALPGGGAGTTGTDDVRWYSFDAGPAHFVALDVAFSEVEPGSPQYRWLDRDLASTDRPWKFVYFHYPLYNASLPHGPNLPLRQALERLLLERRVSVVFASHAHVYERAQGASLGPGQPPLVHIVTGGGGAPLHAPGRDSWTQYAEASYHYVRVTIRGDQIITTGVRADGGEFDRFEGRLDREGWLQPVGTVRSPAVMAGPSATAFVRSAQAAAVVGYTGAWSIAAPLGLSALLYTRRKPVIPVPSGATAPASEPLRDPHTDWRGLPVLVTVAAAIALVLVPVLLTAPLRWLVGFDAYTLLLTAHAIVGTVLVILTALAGSMGYRLAVHRPPSFSWLTATTALAAGLAALMAALGNVLYAQYLRSGGPMEHLVRKAPEAYSILFEFKEYLGLFPLPLATAAAAVVWRYREDLRRDRHLAEVVAVLLLLVCFYCLLPFGLGAAVVRLRGIL